VDNRYLARHVATLKPSGIRKFFDIVATMKDVISLGIGEPDFVTPDSIVQAGVRSLQAGATHYTSNAGLIELRQALSDHLKHSYGVEYDPDSEIVITVGVSEALYLALNALLNPGEEVIIPAPCFVAYQAEAILAGGVPVEVPTFVEDSFQSREMLEGVGRVAEQHDLVVISDELYDQLVYGAPHVCFSSLPGMRPRTVLLGGFSKNYAMTGWRIGYAAAPADILKGLLRIHQYTIMSAPTIAQAAAIEALRNGHEHVARMRLEYDRRRRLIVEGLNRLGLPTFEPYGAFYAFPNIAVTGMDDETFSHKLLEEQRVAVVPGSAFGEGGSGYVRCSYATSYENIEEALRRMERFMRRYG
jgi:aminotransferase